MTGILPINGSNVLNIQILVVILDINPWSGIDSLDSKIQ